ncbi:MAG: cobalt ABC transporter ATP-binding protein [Micrococcales bacterium]|nr:MAG: cobalt ABC transporter ATP-binding protein [Micrococcales bacterium]PIE26472.1 MAG: cobalt ABC transporter ATP-binding protein [Micrococcales bacterium]
MLIEAENVTVHHSQTAAAQPALAGVSLRLDENRIGIIGANGSGKSTFLRLLNGLLVPTTGTVRVDGLDTSKQARDIRRRVGFLFTDPDAQIIMPTVVEDVAFGLRKSALPEQEKRDRVTAALRRFGLTGLGDHPAHLLSGGQKQLLALASVLVTEPRLLVMDEPTTLLDLRNAAMISRVVAGLDQQVVLATHQLELLTGFDRVVLFHDGAVRADGAPGEVVDAYRELMASEPLEPGASQ